MPYFFLSSAPGEEEIFVERFFRDLSAAVRQRAPDSANDVGFIDRRTGDAYPWPADLRLALTTCQTFVALCSPAYFLSASCGRAWQVFTDRLRRHALTTGTQVAALIPVVWSSDGLPTDAFDEAGLVIQPQLTPGNEDLRVLIRIRSHRSAYRAFVAALAHRIVEAAHSQHLTPSPPGTTIDDVVSAFDRQPRWADGDKKPVRVHFVVAAGTREQMASIRSDLQFYGDIREDWAPYRPRVPQPLASQARGVAARCSFDSEVAAIEAIGEQLKAARERNELVVLLVDAWATQLESLTSALRGIDGLHDAEIAVLVSASRDDPETVEHRRRLASGVRRTFPVAIGRQDATFRTEIDTATQFDDDLVRALGEVNGRRRRRAASGPTRRPILGGP
jgi:FxsC-like protein